MKHCCAGWLPAVFAVILAGAAAAGGDSPLIWLSKPDACVQCQPCAAASLDATVAALEARGISVRRAVEHHVPVCQACVVCASGREYAVRVERVNVDALQHAGWVPMREPPAGEEGRE